MLIGGKIETLTGTPNRRADDTQPISAIFFATFPFGYKPKIITKNIKDAGIPVQNKLKADRLKAVS